MNEELKPIEGYEGLYSADKTGRIYSHKSNKYLSSGNPNSYWGYVRVMLNKNGITKSFAVHRLIAKTFIPNPNNYPIVNHKDGNGRNNSVENLEWCTQKENVAHALANDLKGRKKEARKIKWIP
jgi:hypothetical protein